MKLSNIFNKKTNATFRKSQMTLFKSHLASSMLIIFISFLVLASSLFFFFNRYWKSNEALILQKNVSIASEIASNNTYKSVNSFSISNSNYIQTFLNAFAINSNIQILITDKNGNVIMQSSGGASYDNTITTVPSDIVNSAMTHSLDFATTNFNGSLDHSYYISGVPLFYNNIAINNPIGAIVALGDKQELNYFLLDNCKIFFVACLLTLIVAFSIAWYSSAKMIKPLKNMAIAAKKFSSNDFSMRIQSSNVKEISELSEAFNSMAMSLENFEGVRRNFVSNLSHELRTPMTTISGFIDGILDGTIPKERQSYYLNIVSGEIKRLARLVKTMRSLTKIDEGEVTVNRTDIDIVSIIYLVLGMFEKIIEQKNIKIIGNDKSSKFIINADYDMIFQVIYNLVENATKFTNDNGYIEFNVSRINDTVTIKIKNSGVGLDNKELPLIFDKFYKVDKSRGLDAKSMGLGLYISKTIVELHEGEIAVSSVPNQFCEFTIKIKA